MLVAIIVAMATIMTGYLLWCHSNRRLAVVTRFCQGDEFKAFVNRTLSIGRGILTLKGRDDIMRLTSMHIKNNHRDDLAWTQSQIRATLEERLQTLIQKDERWKMILARLDYRKVTGNVFCKRLRLALKLPKCRHGAVALTASGEVIAEADNESGLCAERRLKLILEARRLVDQVSHIVTIRAIRPRQKHKITDCLTIGYPCRECVLMLRRVFGNALVTYSKRDGTLCTKCVRDLRFVHERRVTRSYH